MLAELLPSPEMHDDWRSFARALISSLESLASQSASGAEIEYVVTTTPVDPDLLPPLPAGFTPVWLNSADALLYLGNPDYDPPTAPNVVFIDTAKLADAAINVNKLADGAVTSAKILNATIATADIGNAQIVSALIGDAQVVNAKIGDLAVNNAKIANAAIDSAKIANLAVGTAHIQAAAITSALIGNAQILNAHIQDGAVTNLKIGNTIQSSSWNATTKAGWLIDKNGLIQGQGVAIYDGSGNLVFGSGGSLAWSRITGYDPGSAGNRVRYAEMELGAYGWGPRNVNAPVTHSISVLVASGFNIVRNSITFTASGQMGSLGASGSQFNFPVTAGERLAVSGRVGTSNNNGLSWDLIIVWTNSSGVDFASNVIATGVGLVSVGTLQSGFITAPAGAVEAWLMVSLWNNSAGAGSFVVQLAQPFVGGAADNQTVVQDFSPGPNGFVEQLTSGNISTFIANAAIQQAQIANLAVGTAQIQDLAVTDAKIVSLTAAKISAASLSAITATIGLLRTATSGARLEVESNQIRVYDASNVLRVRMGIW